MDTLSAALGFGQMHMGRYLMLYVCGTLIAMTTGIPVKRILPSPRWTTKTPSLVIQGNRLGRLGSEKTEYLWAEAPSGDGPAEEWEGSPLADTKFASKSDDGYKTRSPMPEEIFPSHSDPFPTVIDTVIESSEMFNEELLSRSSVPFEGPSSLLNTFIFKPSLQSDSYIISPTPTAELSSFPTGSMSVISASWHEMMDYESPWLEKSDRRAVSETPSENFVIVTAISATHIYSHDDRTFSYLITPSLTISDSLTTAEQTSEFFSYANSSTATKIIPTSEVTATSISSHIIKPSISLMSSLYSDENVDTFNGSLLKSSLHNQYFISESIDSISVTLFSDVTSSSRGTFLPEFSTQTYLYDDFADISLNRSLSSEFIIKSVSRFTPTEEDVINQKFTSSNNGVYLIGESMSTISFPDNQFSFDSSFTNYSILSFHSVNDVQTTVTVIGYSDKSSGFSLPTLTVRGTAIGSRPDITASHTVDAYFKSSVLSKESIFSTEIYLTSDFTETRMTEVPEFTEFTENIPVISLWPLSEELPFENANSILSSEFHTPTIIPSHFDETPTTSSYFQHAFSVNASHRTNEVFTSMKSHSISEISSRNFEATKSTISLISNDTEGDNNVEQLATSLSLFQSELRTSFENKSHINQITSTFQKSKFSNEITSDYIIPSQISGAFFSYQTPVSFTNDKSDIGSAQSYHPILTSFSVFNNYNEISELREPTVTMDREINEIIESQHKTTVLNIPQTSIQAKLDSKTFTSSNKMTAFQTFYHSETELDNSVTHHITVRSLGDSSIHEITPEYNGYLTLSEYPQTSQLISFSEDSLSAILNLATDYSTSFVENVSDMSVDLITKSLYTKSVIPSDASKTSDIYLLSNTENVSSEEYEINFPLDISSIYNILSSSKFEDIYLTLSETVTENHVKMFISSTPAMTEEETTFAFLDTLILPSSYRVKPFDTELFDKSRTYLISTPPFSLSFWGSLDDSYDGFISHELRSSPVYPPTFDKSDILFISSEEEMLQDSFLTTFRSYGEDLTPTSPTFVTILENFSTVSESFFNITDLESFLPLHPSSKFKDSSNTTEFDYHSNVETSDVIKTEVNQSSTFVSSEASKTGKYTDSDKSRFELESKFDSLTRSTSFSSHVQVSNIPFPSASEDFDSEQFSSISKDTTKNYTESFDTFDQVVNETYNLSGSYLASSELMSTFAILSPSSFMVYQTPTLSYVSTADSGVFHEYDASISREYDASKIDVKVLPTDTFVASSEIEEMPFKSLPNLFLTPSIDPSINTFSYLDFSKSTESSAKAISDMQDVLSKPSINFPSVETEELKYNVTEEFSSHSVTKHTSLQATITEHIPKLTPSMNFTEIKDPASIESSQPVPRPTSLALTIPKKVPSLFSSGYQTSAPNLSAAPSLHESDSKFLSSSRILTDWKVISQEANLTFKSFDSKTISNKTTPIFVSSDSISRILPAMVSSDSKITISKVTPLLLSSDWKATRSKTAPLLASSTFTDSGLKPTWFTEESTSLDYDNDTLMVSVLAVSSFTGFNNSKNITAGIGISGTSKNEWPYSTVGTWPQPTMDTELFKDNHYWVLSVLEAPMKDLPENFSHTMEIRFANAYSEAFRRRTEKKGSNEPEDMIIVKILSLTNDLLLRQLEIIYVVEKGGSLVPATIASEYLSSLRYEQLREFLGHHAIVKARPYQPDKETEAKPLGSLIPVTAIICGILGGLLLILCCLILYCRCCRPKPAPSSPASSASGSLQRSLSKYGQHNRKHMFQEMAHHLTTEMATQMKQGSAAHELYYPEKRAPSGRSLPALPIKGSPEDEPSARGYEKSMKILKILENKDAATSPIPGKHSRGMRDTDESPLEKKKQPKPKKRRKSKESLDQRTEEKKSSSLRPVPSLPKPSSKMEVSDAQKETESPDSGTSSRQFSSPPSSDKGGEETGSDGSNAELLPPLQDLISRSKSECEAATAETHLHLSRVRQRISDLLDDAFALAGGRKLYGSLRSKKIDPATDIFPRFASMRSQSATEEQIASTNRERDEDRRPISEGGQRILGAITDDGKLITRPPPKLVWEQDDEHSLMLIDRPVGEITEARNRHLNFFPFHQQNVRHLPSVSTSSSLSVLDTLHETLQDTVIPSASAINLLREAASELYLAHSPRINPAVVDQYDEIDVVSALRNGEPVATLIQAIKDELQKFSGSIPGSNTGESHA